MTSEYEPLYMQLYRSGRLHQLAEELMEVYADCQLCPHMCRVDRHRSSDGFCQAPAVMHCSAAYPHLGNEPMISGYAGSGNIFLTYCNSRCVFCQNDDVSQKHVGQPLDVPALSELYLKLQEHGCHNVDFVTPQHFLPHIVAALPAAIDKGFKLPLVYNTNGYEHLGVLKKVRGLFDIYLPDFKFADDTIAEELTGMRSYATIVKKAIAEMYHQVGLLQLDSDGIAQRGLIVRHLVMPNNVGNTESVMQAIADIDPAITVNIMAQYHPAYRASEFQQIDRKLNADEYQEALDIAADKNLINVMKQNRFS